VGLVDIFLVLDDAIELMGTRLRAVNSEATFFIA
jgi:hypothetical protein